MIVALIVVGTLLVLVATYTGNIVFMGDPFSYIMSYVSIFAPIVICAVIIKFASNRRGEKILE